MRDLKIRDCKFFMDQGSSDQTIPENRAVSVRHNKSQGGKSYPLAVIYKTYPLRHASKEV